MRGLGGARRTGFGLVVLDGFDVPVVFVIFGFRVTFDFFGFMSRTPYHQSPRRAVGLG